MYALLQNPVDLLVLNFFFSSQTLLFESVFSQRLNYKLGIFGVSCGLTMLMVLNVDILEVI